MRLRRGLKLLTLLCGSAAFAQQDVYEPPGSPPPTPQSSRSDRNDTMAGNIRDSMSIRAGAGFEGYSGALSNRMAVGPTWGATLSTQPLGWLGAEVAYSGAANETTRSTTAVPEGLANGADMVRNGGQVAATVSVPVPFVQPYGLVGLGIDSYNIRGGQALGFQDDVAGRVPIGGGLRAKVGPFSADARLAYDALFSDNFSFSPLTGTPTSGGAYTGMLQVGGRF